MASIYQDERRKIERWRQVAVSIEVNAEKLGRHRGDAAATGHFGFAANSQAKKRRGYHRRLFRRPKLRAGLAPIE